MLFIVKNFDDQNEDLNLYKSLNSKESIENIKKKNIFESKFNFNFLTWQKKEEFIIMAKENYNIFKRLNAKKAYYTLNSHLRDYEKAQYYKYNHCKYPSIDFYRTAKSSSSSCSIFNYCTYNNYNSINNEFSNVFKKRLKIKGKNKTLQKMSKIKIINKEKEREKVINKIFNNYYLDDKKKSEEIRIQIDKKEENKKKEENLEKEE